MKILVQYTETGMYKDYSWGNPTMRTKGQLHAVEPAFAATLIKTHKACLHKNEDGEIVIQR